jgi:hypothetical protein
VAAAEPSTEGTCHAPGVLVKRAQKLLADGEHNRLGSVAAAGHQLGG